MSASTGSSEEGGEKGLGQEQHTPQQAAPVSILDVALRAVEALNRIAAAIEANAEATELLARATAGEFDDEGGVAPVETDMAGRPLT